MFRLWGKLWADNHLLRDMVYENDDDSINRTKKVLDGLDEICHSFDLSRPIWLDSTIRDFQKHAKCRFTSDNFVDSIEFDFLEIHVIEE